MANMPAVTAVLLHHSAVYRGTDFCIVSTGYRGMNFCLFLSAVLLHHSIMNTVTDCSVVSKRQRGNGVYACSYCSTVSSLFYGYRD